MQYNATFVIGPAGSGKSHFCKMLNLELTKIGRHNGIVNFDPAAENLPYTPSVDVRDIINLDKVYNDDNINLGPNGALTYCLKYLSNNMNLVLDKLQQVNCNFLIFDFPGQIEIYVDGNITRKIINELEANDFKICALFLLDSQFMIDESKFISGMLCSVATMINLQVTYINILTKGDLLTPKEIEQFENYFACNTTHMLSLEQDNKFNTRHRKLHRIFSEITNEYSCQQFTIIDRDDPDTIENVIDQLDLNLQYEGQVDNYEDDVK